MLESLIKAAEIGDFIVSERMKIYESSFYLNRNTMPPYRYFTDILEYIPVRDRIKLTLEDESECILKLSGSFQEEEAYGDFLNQMMEEESVCVRIQIEKTVLDGHFSIYSYHEFAKDMLSLSIEEVMGAFSELFRESSKYIIFHLYDEVSAFSTKTMFFVPDGTRQVNMDFDRNKRMESCREVSYFYNFDQYEVIPDDFKIEFDYENNPLSLLFEKISALLSVSFIATSSTINDQQIRGVINGQRSVEYSCAIDDLPNNKILYRIYNWIYTDGNPVDKAIIARNVISLHCRYVSIMELNEQVIASIQSNYRLYLKDNVAQYLELKNKVAEFISEIISKTGEYATRLLDKFKSNLIAIFGFLFTVILTNLVSNQPLEHLFTDEITILMECVLLGSFVYLIICCLQSRYEIEKVYESYEKLKRNYHNILTEDDIREVFGNDELLESMKTTVHKSKIIYTGLWMLFLAGAFMMVEVIGTKPAYRTILKVIHAIAGFLT